MTTFLRAEIAAWGCDVTETDTLSALAPRLPQGGFATAGHFVGACRRLAARRPGWNYTLEGDGRIDGRLVALGWRHFSPTGWLRPRDDGRSMLDRFISYWEAASERPDTVGSSRNRLGPEGAYRSWRQGIPAHAARALAGVAYGPRNGYARPSPAGYRRIVRAACAARRTSMGADARRFAPAALAALGRLSPEAQRIVLEALRADPRWGPKLGHEDYISEPHWGSHVTVNRVWTPVRRVVRVRDIPWDALAPRIRMLADSRARVAAAKGRRQTLLAAPQTVREVLAYPQWPNLPTSLSARLRLGESPTDLAPGLTAREAHRWLAACSTAGQRVSPAGWLLEQHGQFRHGAAVRDSVPTARWLLAVLRDPERRAALERTRTLRGPGGREIEVRLEERLDEIQDEDLVEGTATSVVRAFERAAERHGFAATQAALQDHRVLCPAPRWRVPSWMRVLRTPAALAAEGAEQAHCVAGYTQFVERGEALILALRIRGVRTTVEVTPDLATVRQHHGYGNSEAPALSQALFERWRARQRNGGRR